MTNQEFSSLYNNVELKEYLSKIITAKTKNIEFREDLLQEVWGMICNSPVDQPLSFYKHEAFRLVDKLFHRELRIWQSRKKYVKGGHYPQKEENLFSSKENDDWHAIPPELMTEEERRAEYNLRKRIKRVQKKYQKK